jgi:AcrR family transcriptional regulator
MAQPSQSPQTTEDGSTRERMLDAALSAFSELGYDGASTREIASRAGVNQGLIPYYFGSKEALWQEAVNRAFAEIRGGVGAVIESGESLADRERIAEMIRRLVHFAARNPEFHRLMTNEGKCDGPRMHWIVDNHVRPIYDGIATLAKRAAPDSPLARLDPLIMHYLLVGAATHLFHQAPECIRLTGRDPSDPDIIEAHCKALIAMFVGPIQGESE